MIYSEEFINKFSAVTDEVTVAEPVIEKNKLLKIEEQADLTEEIHGNIRNERKWKRLATVLSLKHWDESYHIMLQYFYLHQQ